MTDRGAELLRNSKDLEKRDSLPPHRETYYDTVDKKLLISNRWLKVIDGNHDCVVFKKVVEYDREIISYERMECALDDIPELKGLELEPLCTFVVEREVLLFKQRFIIHIDKVAYPDGDPHCVCYIHQVGIVPGDLYMQLMGCCISPVRNKIGEYLYRYDKKTYRMMKDDSIYRMSMLDSQWDTYQLLDPELYLRVVARAEGRSLTGPDPWEGVDWEEYSGYPSDK